jgi:hypothetical protein
LRTERSIRVLAAAAILAAGLVPPGARAAEVSFSPTLNASYYWDGNTEIVQEDGETTSDRAIRLSLSLPVRVSRPLWSFNTSYSISGRVYNEREDSNDVSQSLSLGYNRTLTERNTFGVSASASRTEDQQVEPDAPDQPITYLPRSPRTNVNASISGSTDVSARSDVNWSVGASTVLYDDTTDLDYEDADAYSATGGWSYRISEMTSAGFGYRYGRSVYEDRPDAESHALAYTGSTTTRQQVGLTYALGVIATDTGNGEGWTTNGGANFAARYNPRPDHSLSAGIRQDVSVGRGLGGPTLDRGAYVGWSWSHVRGLGIAVTGGYWTRESVEGLGDETKSLFVSESLSWGFGEYLRLGLFHSYRDQTDDRPDATGPTFDTSYHTAGINLGWTILGARQNR